MEPEVYKSRGMRAPEATHLQFTLSRIIYKDLLDARGMKEVVYRGFLQYPDIQEGDARWFLYRATSGGSPQKPMVSILVASRLAPDWGAIRELADVREEALRVPLLEGLSFHFELRAAPMRRLPGGTSSVIRDEGDQITWLQRQGAQRGFQVEKCAVRPNQMRIRRTPEQVKQGKSDGWSQIFADFSGRLKITDPKLFVSRYLDGIGKSKAFGLGMLILKK